MTLTEEEKTKLIEVHGEWAKNPILRHYSFSDKKLWSKQEEILWSVKNNKRTCVKSANTVGKSFISADVVMDWLTSHYPAKVITTASSWTQVEEILWKEIRLYCVNSKIPMGTIPLNTSLKFNDEHFAMGISVDTPVRLQGFHSPNLLVVIDEASGIKPEIWDMIEALHPKAILAIGNPLEASGRFCECFSSPLWHKITISALDAVLWQDKNGAIPGLVTREWVNEMADIHGKSSPWYRVHVEGEFPEQDESALIQREWVDRARKGIDCDGLPIEEEDEQSKTRIISCDMATKHGDNLTVIGYRYGHTFSQIKGYMRASSTYTRDELQLLYSAKEAQIVVVDSDGVGESMEDLLKEVHVPSLAFHGGYGAKSMDDKQYRNLRSQFFWIIAKKFEKGLYNLKHLTDKEFEILRAQLTSIRVKAPDALGRFQIETKEEMMARGIKSPDYADCFMMSEYAFWMRKHAELRPRSYGSL